MRALDDYEFGERVAERRGSITYRGRARGHSESVVIKVVRADPSSNGGQTLTRCRREYDAGRTVEHESIVRYLDFRATPEGALLIQEDFGGVCLERLTPQTGFDITLFLDLAIQLANAVAAIHDRGIIHANVRPQSIFINPDTHTAKLAAFGHAFQFRQEAPAASVAEPDSERLAFSAPEQSGRTTGVVDYRADLYSLGATFYHMLSGVTPFGAEDALALTYSHVARVQEPLEKRRADIPVVLARIVDKLLDKDPRCRYQSAHGLAADLVRCRRELDTEGHILAFELAQEDLPARIVFPDRLYGRQAEERQLAEKLAQVRAGASAIVWLAGEAGSGKSSLLRAVAQPVTRAGGLVLHGKAEQGRADEPYAALSSAISEWVNALLTRPGDELTHWQRLLTTTLGPNLHLLVEAMPALEKIVGTQASAQPRVGAASAPQTRARFLFAFVTLLELLAQRAPLVLCLEDLQWASVTLIQLLQSMFTQARLPPLLFIGSYRNEVVDAEAPVRRMVTAIADAKVATETIELEPLEEAHVAELLADTLRADPAGVAPLARVVWQKAGGNPLAVRTFIEELEAEGKLRPSPPSGRWTWAISEIRMLPPSEGTLASLQRKLERLPETTHKALWTASRVGTSFDISTLSTLLEQSAEEAWQAFLPAIRDGLVSILESEASEPLTLPDTEDYPELCFTHDRVQQACAALSVAGDERALHGRIAKLLLATLSHEQRNKRIFEIVEHLSLSEQPAANTAEAERLVDLNLLAGQKARMSAAYVEGFRYFERALALLTLPDAWSTAHERTFELHVGLAECAGVMNQTASARRTFELVSAHVRSPSQRVTLVRAWVALEAGVLALDAVIELVRTALAELGVALPGTHEIAADTPLIDWARTERVLAEHTLEELVAWREATSEHDEAVLELLALAVPAAYILSKPLFRWLALKSVQHSLSHGFTKSSSFSFAGYALDLAMRTEDTARAVKFGRVALRLAERFPATDLGRVHYVYGLFLCHWSEPAEQAIAHFRTALTRSIEMGDPFHGRLAALLAPLVLTQLGRNVSTVSQAPDKKLDLIQSGFSRVLVGQNALLQAFARSLSATTPDPTRLELEQVPEEALAKAMSANQTILSTFQFFKLELLVLHGKWADAIAFLKQWDRLILGELGAWWLGVEYTLLSALAIAAWFRESPGAPDAELASMLAQRRNRLRKWAALYPANFENKHLLVEAELLDLEGERTRAAELYDASIEAATRSGFVHEVAFANERAAWFYLRQDRKTLAQGYLERASEAFWRWGAIAKARELLRRRSDLAATPLSAELDLTSAFKASQAISRETRLYDLVQRVLQLCAENAGAERALFVFQTERGLQVAACWPACGPPIDPEVGVPLAPEHQASAGILRYVLRTGESLVLDNAAEEGEFTEDATIRDSHARSILALPLSRADPQSGVLYLENRLTPGAFMRRRLDLLDLLVRQASISIDNARYFERTRRLNEALARENRQRESAETELRASERRLAGFLDGLPVGVVIFRPQRCLHYVNRTALRIFGISDTADAERAFATVFRSGASEVVSPDALPSWRALQGEVVWDDDLELRRDDVAIALTVWASPLRDASGRVEYAVVAFQDVTEAKRAAAERARLEDQVRQATKMESIGRLAASVAHDFNNMLMPIQGYAELAAKADRHEEIVEYLGYVQQAAQQAAELTRSLLAFARQQVLDMTPLNMSAEIIDNARILESVVREDIELVRDLPTDMPSVRADRSQLRQVLMNLVVNACDAMPHGGRLVIRTNHVTLQAPLLAVRNIPPGDYVVLTVADTGTGMDAATQARIFEPFFTTKEQGKGVGLGLASMFGIVEQHKGYVRLRSRPGHGTVFEIWFPTIAAAASPEVADEGEEPPHATSHRQRLLLIVEDDTGVRRFIEHALQQSGAELLVADSASRALELMRNAKRVPDAVITDVVLPKMNGRELLAVLRKDHPKLPGVFISGYAAHIFSAEEQLPPHTRFLVKPFSVKQLHKCLDELLA